MLRHSYYVIDVITHVFNDFQDNTLSSSFVEIAKTTRDILNYLHGCLHLFSLYISFSVLLRYQQNNMNCLKSNRQRMVGTNWTSNS